MPAKQNIVIVGGGSGADLARELSKTLDSSKYDLILISNRPNRIHLISALRMVVSPADDLEKTSILPYDRLFFGGKGTFKQGTLASIEKSPSAPGGAVILENGERVQYRVLVLATGSKWEGPLDFPTEPHDVSQSIKAQREDIKKAQNIVLVGGGAVGMELAGEIKDVYPSKKVTIVQNDKHLLNGTYPEKFRKSVQRDIRARGIELVLEDRLEGFTTENGSVKTQAGRTLRADLVIPTRGPKPNTGGIISSLGDSVASSSGFITVTPTFQLPSHPDIFAIGDITDLPEQKQAAKAGNHAKIVAANIPAYLSSSKMTEYTKATEIIVVTNGKNGGRGYFGIAWGITVGNRLSSMMKSRQLFVPMFATGQGY